MAAVLGLGIDESYMVAAGRAFHLGYFDHPPIAWWLSAGIAQLTGSDAAVVVRLPFIALFAVSTWLMFALTARLFDARAGLLAAAAFNLAPVFGLSTGSWVLPDGPLVCALLAAAVCLVRAVEDERAAWWIGAGVAAGFALLSKYSAALVLAGALVAFLSQPALRVWLRRPGPYVAASVALAMFSPVLIWNAEHGWISFAFQGGRAVAAQWRPYGPLIVFAGEATFLLPWIWLGLAVVFLRGLRAGRADWRRWLLCCLAFLPVLLFAVIGFWSRNVLFHWASPGYLFLFPLLGDWLARWPVRQVRAWALGSTALITVLLVLVSAEVRARAISRFLPGPDPSLQAVDWTPLRAALRERGLLDGRAIGAPSWNDAGKIDYALGGLAPVIVLNTDARQYLFSPGPSSHLGEDIVIVAPRQDQARIESAYASVFDRIEKLPPLDLDFGLRGKTQMNVFIGHHLHGSPNG